ncbi:MAG: YkgJ family cysteine cluster protein [Acidobacteria bacterium]|nr:MAG: YkgJ family cysteine cluster protein [Acidobacteriota bacterium]
MAMSRRRPVFYDCSKCPAYCCSYARIRVHDRDLRRLARHFAVDLDAARRRYTKKGDGGERVLRHRRDAHFGSVCRFLDPATRRCTIYHARPEICRAYPGTVRCGYYDFLSAERRLQADPDYVATTWNP